MNTNNEIQLRGNIFNPIGYNPKKLSIRLYDEIIKNLNTNEGRYLSNWIMIILYYLYINKKKDWIFFLKFDNCQNTTLEELTINFFIKINQEVNFKNEILFIPIDLLFDNLSEDKETLFNESLKYIFNEMQYSDNNDFLRLIIKEYKVLPIHKKMLRDDTVKYDERYFNTFLHYFIENEILRKYSIDNDIKQYNKKGNKIVSIDDDKSPLFLILNRVYESRTVLIEKGKSYFINPNMSKIFNANTLSLDLMINMLGYDIKEIKDLLKKVSNKKLSILMVGLGGTMSNFVYFSTELMKLVGLENNIFKDILVVDFDKLDVSNLPRIPLDYITPIFAKLDLNKDLHHKVNMLYNVTKLADRIVTRKEYIKNNINFDKHFNWVIGTPDLNTRTNISEKTNRFICPMHSDNELYIYISPKVIGRDLMFETYGRIRLSRFFFNMLEMTIQCLKLMLNDNLDDKVEQMVYNYSIDRVNIENNLIKFKRKESVII